MFNIAKKATKVKQQFSSKPERKWQKGVTLIEMIVAVSIIILLVIALYSNINSHVAKARDADRKKDLQTIKEAFEDYYNDRGSYPPAGILSNCGSFDLDPWLKQIPCDEVGQPYLYLPVNKNGTACTASQPCAGYRVLTQLTVLTDPMIKQVGCPTGCGGIPAAIPNRDRYNYGISEGVVLNQNAAYVIPIVNPSDCTSVSCYCCNSPPASCNLYAGPSFGSCHSNAYETAADCAAATACN